MEKIELVIIPSPGLSHLTTTVDAAKLLLRRDHRLSITFLIMKLPNDDFVETYTQKISSDPNSSSLRLINLPNLDHPAGSHTLLFDMIGGQIDNVRDALSDILRRSPARVAGVVFDMFCTRFVDVADEFGLPSYVFFTSSASSFGLFSHITRLKFELDQKLSLYDDSGTELSVPHISIKVPGNVLPRAIVKEDAVSNFVLDSFRRFERTRGVLINTFYELESYAIRSLSSGKSTTPKIYHIGPILNFSQQVESTNVRSYEDGIKKWLDHQPESSVVFLCFGSKGTLDVLQLKEIASALERSGLRFLWSVRKPGEKLTIRYGAAEKEEGFEHVLPEGFLERTEGRGRVIGWAPQLAALSHPAVGGFVSHCGWNSTLESVWCGVPVATLPLQAEQQLNAFQLVREYGMAEEIRVDYRRDPLAGPGEGEVVGSEEIESALRRLMAADGRSGVLREKVRRMQEESRLALEEGGSSYEALTCFIEDLIKNMHQLTK